MSAQSLLRTIITIASELIPADISGAQLHSMPPLAVFEYVLCVIVYKKIKSMLTTYQDDQEISEADAVKLQEILAEIFTVTKDTNLVATYNPNVPLTNLLMIVAQYLEEFFKPTSKQSRLQFLMPSLVQNQYEASGIDLRDADLELQDFVLTDDNAHLLEVFACLNFAEEDGQLKYTFLIDGQIKELSAAEKTRVIEHSNETKEYWQKIQNKLAITLYGPSCGAVLRKLCTALRQGGEHSNGGQEMDSGAEANIGILQFSQWYSKLSDADKFSLSALRTQNCFETLGSLLARLFRPKDTQFKELTYCVELIANKIDDIIQQNPNIFNMHPEHDASDFAQEIEFCTTQVTNARTRLEAAIASPTYKITTKYDDAPISALYCNILSFVKSNTNVIPSLFNFLSSSIFIETLFITTPRQLRMRFITEIAESFSKLDLKFYRFADIRNLIYLFDNTDAKIQAVKVLAPLICANQEDEQWLKKLDLYNTEYWMNRVLTTLEHGKTNGQRLLDLVSMDLWPRNVNNALAKEVVALVLEPAAFAGYIQSRVQSEHLKETLVTIIHDAFEFEGLAIARKQVETLISLLAVAARLKVKISSYYDYGILLRDCKFEVFKSGYYMVLFLIPALQCDARAQYELAKCYYQVWQESKELQYLLNAQEWFMKAAEQGIDVAEYLTLLNVEVIKYNAEQDRIGAVEAARCEGGRVKRLQLENGMLPPQPSFRGEWLHLPAHSLLPKTDTQPTFTEHVKHDVHQLRR